MGGGSDDESDGMGDFQRGAESETHITQTGTIASRSPRRRRESTPAPRSRVGHDHTDQIAGTMDSAAGTTLIHTPISIPTTFSTKACRNYTQIAISDPFPSFLSFET